MYPDTDLNCHNYPDNVFHANEICYKVAGIWIPPKTCHIFIKIACLIYFLALYSFAFYFCFCEIWVFFSEAMMVREKISHLGKLFTHIVGIIKLFVLLFNNEKIHFIMESLQNKNFFYEQLRKFSPANFLMKEKNRNAKFAMTLMTIYTVNGILSHIASTLILNLSIKGDSFEGTNKTCLDFMAYKTHVPFPQERKSDCQMTFLFVDIGLSVYAFLIACYDGLVLSLLSILKCQLLILGKVFSSVREQSLQALHLPRNFEMLHDEENQAFENEMYHRLCQCTAHLQLLFKVRDAIEETFCLVILAQTLSSLLILGSCLYNATMVPLTSIEFFVQMMFFVCVLVQFSLLCWYGSEVTSASELIRVSIYECNWLSSSRRFKTCLIINLMRTQKPVYLTIGKFSQLTLDTLVAVIRGSFTYMAVFKTMQ